MSGAPTACGRCLARSWLLGRLSGHLDRVRAQIGSLLELEADGDLIAAVGGRHRDAIVRELARLDAGRLRSSAAEAGLELICRCDPAYPARLRALAAPPAVLHVAGGLTRFLTLADQDPVAIVGTRRPSSYGAEMARSLGRGLASAGVTIVSGMALGVDSSAHAGALAAQRAAGTIAVLPGSADRPYPAGKRVLHRRITASGAAVSELGPPTSVRRWMFPARNRVIAALAAATIVVEAGERSGSLVTARLARALGRPVGAVPGRVTAAEAAGPNELLARGAHVVRGPQDVLDQLFGDGVRTARATERAALTPGLRELLVAIREGHDTAAALARAGFPPERGLAELAALELTGYISRTPGGKFCVIP
jgi:DNA processing protein